METWGRGLQVTNSFPHEIGLQRMVSIPIANRFICDIGLWQGWSITPPDELMNRSLGVLFAMGCHNISIKTVDTDTACEGLTRGLTLLFLGRRP